VFTYGTAADYWRQIPFPPPNAPEVRIEEVCGGIAIAGIDRERRRVGRSRSTHVSHSEILVVAKSFTSEPQGHARCAVVARFATASDSLGLTQPGGKSANSAGECRPDSGVNSGVSLGRSFVHVHAWWCAGIEGEKLLYSCGFRRVPA